MVENGIRWWALCAWLTVLLPAGAATWVGFQVVLLTMSHPGLATRRDWIENVSLLVGGAVVLVAALVGLARELRR